MSRRARSWTIRLIVAVLGLFFAAGMLRGAETLAVKVETEEDVYSYAPAENGAGPLWCSGSTCLVRVGQDLFASGLETIQNCVPLNNCRWVLFQRGADGWRRVQVDEQDRTREPCPLAAFPDGRLFLSANPTLLTHCQPGGGPAQPRLIEFSAAQPGSPARPLHPEWQGTPKFTEHSYRSFAADGPNRELILFQNIDYTHAEWSFWDRTGRWAARGKLTWPWGAEYDKPEPIRVCYPTVALRDRAVYFCGVSDVIEPYQKWREYKRQLTGREWDYDFRRLFFTWTPDIREGKFADWVEIASRDKTCGWISPRDLWVDANGSVHLLWSERAIDERLREKFFPNAKQSHALNYAIVREGKVVLRRTLVESGDNGGIPGFARFQVTPDQRLLVFYFVEGTGAGGQAENRVLEVGKDGSPGRSVRVALKTPFIGAFTATIRAGSPASHSIELLGEQAGKTRTISYARVRID